MQELFLKHAEFLAALDAVKATVIVGAAAGTLFPQDKEEREAVLQEGRLLLERRLLIAGDQFNADLFRAARIMAYPQIAMILIREVIPLGPQLFLLYQSQEGIIEHTCPGEGLHRLALIPNIPSLLVRATQILSLRDQDAIKASVEIEQEAFFKVHDLAQHSQHKLALEMLQRAGMIFTVAEAFVVAMELPIFSGQVIMLKCADQTIIDARDIVLVQDQQTAWYVMQVIAGQPLLCVKSVHDRAMYDVLSHCFAELAV